MTGTDDTPAVPDDVDEKLDDLADELQEPKRDDADRRQQQEAAEEAASNPRRE
jgi:hypothetical protein